MLILIGLNLVTLMLDQYGRVKSEWMRTHIEAWKLAVVRFNFAIFEAGMGIARLVVLVLIIGTQACLFAVHL